MYTCITLAVCSVCCSIISEGLSIVMGFNHDSTHGFITISHSLQQINFKSFPGSKLPGRDKSGAVYNHWTGLDY